MWDGNLYRQNVIDPRWNYDRHVTVHLPESLPSTQTLMTIFDATPDTHLVPRLAVSADVSGNLWCTQQTSCHWSIHQSHQVQKCLRNGVVNSCMQKNAY